MAILKISLVAVLAACSAVAADTSLLSLISPDAKVVSGINVNRTVASPFGQFLLKEMEKNDRDLQKLMLSTGFDPRRDLTEVIAAATDVQHKGHGLVVARGIFDSAKLTALARVSGGTVTNYKDVQVISGQHDGWIAFLDNQTVVAGDPDLVRSAIDRRGKNVGLDPKLVSKVNEVSVKYDVWVASIAPLSDFAGKLPDARMNGAISGDMVQGIEQASGGVMFGSTIRVAADAVMRSEKDATALADVVRFLAGMVQVNRDKPDAARLAGIVDSMTLQASANILSISFSVPATDLEQMIKPARRTAPIRKVSVQK